MRITFDKLEEGRSFPLSRDTARRILSQLIPAEIQPRFTKVHFGCNRKTSQEARLVGRGETYEIRVNFWLEHERSRIVSESSEWLDPVRNAGGLVDEQLREVRWSSASAQRYAAFLLAHEVAHVAYAQVNFTSSISGRSASRTEEAWCDRWAREATARLKL